MKVTIKSATDLLIITPGPFQMRAGVIDFGTAEDNKRILETLDRDDTHFSEKVIIIPETGKIKRKKERRKTMAKKKPMGKKKPMPKKPKY